MNKLLWFLIVLVLLWWFMKKEKMEDKEKDFDPKRRKRFLD
jgi:hypothetical protein